MRDTILKTFVEVSLPQPSNFLKIRETLTRIGIVIAPKTVSQVCHILHKRGRYYIVHFKELLVLDGAPIDLDDLDVYRRNTIATLLEEWNLVNIVNSDVVSERAPMSQLKVVSHKDKDNWTLQASYVMGKKF